MEKLPIAGKKTDKKIRILCQRCGKEAHILFDASPEFRVICIACRSQRVKEKGLELKKRRQQISSGQ